VSSSSQRPAIARLPPSCNAPWQRGVCAIAACGTTQSTAKPHAPSKRILAITLP
jgi:hypothetical protein